MNLRRTIRLPGIWLGVEILLILGWTYLLAGQLLDFDPWKIIQGRDYFDNVQGFYFWEHVKSCGTCALWNGDLNGGAPALIDPQNPLHPIIAISTLFWGVTNGAKVILFLSLFLGGLGQLWIGYEIGVGRLARLAPALIAVGAGHLVGPLEGGHVGMTLGVASLSLVIAAALHLRRQPTTRSVALGALALAGALVTGQGYLQVAIIVLLPTAFLLLAGKPLPRAESLFGWMLAGGLLTFALAAPFLVSFLWNLPRIGKLTDPYFQASQPLQYVPTNFVIKDWNYYHNPGLESQPFGFLYISYVGWIVLGLAIIGIVPLFRRNLGVAAFFTAMFVGSLLLGAREPIMFVYDHVGFWTWLQEFIAGLRTLSVVTKVAVIPILAFAAMGIEHLVSWRPSVRNLQVRISASSWSWALSYHPNLQLLALLLCIFALLDIRGFDRQWLFPLQEADRASVEEILVPLKTKDLQWVEPPYGENWLLPFATPAELKIANEWRPWHFEDATTPPPALEISRGDPPNYQAEEIGSTSGGLPIFEATDQPRYVSFNGETGDSPCSAQGEGGNIDITCSLTEPGAIQVLELSLPGWQATINGKEVDVGSSGQWLGINVPAGDLDIALRYRPWHVWFGFGLGLIGLVWAALWIVRPVSLSEWTWPRRPKIRFILTNPGQQELP